jgi:hypothetical protein
MRAQLVPAALAALTLAPVPLAARQDHAHGEMLGTVQFPVSCTAPAAAEARRGLALLHHMTYEAAAEAFAGAVKADPRCAMGYWGQAMAVIHPLWSAPPSVEKFARGAALLEEARRRAKAGGWEADWIAATQAYFAAGRGAREAPNLQALARGWTAVHEAHPGDVEAAAFHALTLLPTADPADKSHLVRRRAGAVAESVLARVPDHPGAHHYVIHANDVPEMANDAVRVAHAYSRLAPEVPHALHMPSHIFVRTGDWDNVIDWNRRSAEAALARPVGDSLSVHYLHALDYLAYGYLQQGRDAEARQVAATLAAIRQPMQTEGAVPYTLAAVPARLALERQDWKAAAALEARMPADYPWDRFPAMEALTHFAVALGAARTGDLPRAQRAVARLAELRAAAAAASPYWAKQIEIQRLAAEAWLEFAAGRKDEALTAMQQAAELEATTDKHPITPGELLPASELLGDMLLQLKRPKEALAAYQEALARSPGRRNALRGVERAGGKGDG